MVMVMLALLGATFLAASRTEFTIARSEASAAKALSLAEAGVALGIRTLKNTSNWDTLLTNPPTVINCPALVPAADGGCTYQFENDAAEAGTPTNDSNRIVVVKSTGTYKTTAKEVDIAFTRPPIIGGPGGLIAAGNSANLSFSGSANAIDGNNWVPPSDNGVTPAVQDNNACGPGTGPKFGIATPNATQQSELADDASGQPASIMGAAPNPPISPATVASIGVSTEIPPLADVQALAESLAAQAHVTYTPGTVIDNVVMSTQAAPKIFSVDCTGYTGGGSAGCLQLGGTTSGAGILIVKNGFFQMRATAAWTGLIIVHGATVRFDTGGGGGDGNIVYGQVWIAETNPTAQSWWYRPRNTKLRYSCDALKTANMATGFSSTTTKPIVWWKQVY